MEIKLLQILELVEKLSDKEIKDFTNKLIDVHINNKKAVNSF